MPQSRVIIKLRVAAFLKIEEACGNKKTISRFFLQNNVPGLRLEESLYHPGSKPCSWLHCQQGPHERDFCKQSVNSLSYTARIYTQNDLTSGKRSQACMDFEKLPNHELQTDMNKPDASKQGSIF